MNASLERFPLQLARSYGREAWEIELRGDDGAPIGKAIFGRSDVRIKTSTDNGMAFVRFLQDELPALMEKFRQNLVN